jgi:hypothetical protein
VPLLLAARDAQLAAEQAAKAEATSPTASPAVATGHKVTFLQAALLYIELSITRGEKERPARE